MVNSTRICLEERDPAELLAYLEGDLPPDNRKELEEHLTLCEVCSREMESLRRLDKMLKARPECFHPDEEDLYRFAADAQDPHGNVSAHLETCEQCREAVAILRDMAAVGHQISTPARPMPRELLRRLEERYSVRRSPAEPTSPLASLLEWLRKPFSLPMLAAGTAAAALVVVVLLVPIWTGLRDVPKPQVIPPSEETQQPPLAKEGRFEGPDLPAKSEATAPREPGGKPENALQEPKTAPSPSSLPLPPLEEPGPALEKAEPLKPKEGLGQVPASSRLSESRRSEKSVRGYLGQESERRGGLLEKIPPKRKLAAPAAPMMHGQMDVQAKPKVMVRIIPPAGEKLPGVTFVPPEDLASRYLFTEQMRAEKESTDTKGRKPQPTAIATAQEAFYIVTIRVNRSETAYDLEGKVTEQGSTIARRTLSKRNVALDDLQAEIRAVVAALLSGH